MKLLRFCLGEFGEVEFCRFWLKPIEIKIKKRAKARFY